MVNSIKYVVTPECVIILKIEEINEPSTCHYHLVVGTNLLCPKVDMKIKSKEEMKNSINCLVLDS